MRRVTLDRVVLGGLVALLCVLPPTSTYRDLDLVHQGERIDLAAFDFSEARVYAFDFTWQKKFWQGSVLEIWADDCLRSLVVNGNDLSQEVSYCDWVGHQRIDLAPYLADGATTLAMRVENLGGPGGFTIKGTGNVFVGVVRYWLIFLLILIWLYRRGGAQRGVREVEIGLADGAHEARGAKPVASSLPFRGMSATIRLAYGAGLFVVLAAIVGLCLVELGGAPPSSLAEPGSGVAAPSWAEDERLNPRRLVEAGEFLMGSPEGFGHPDEQPQRRVRVSRFWIQQHPVTNAEYRRFKPKHGFNDGEERFPVVAVTWKEALAYAEWLGGSLPTEAQWEFAARGARGRKYPWGDQEPTCARANFNDCGGRVEAVGSRPEGATPTGIEGLAGNVWEWCWDGYADRYAPDTSTDPRGPGSEEARVMRGGSFVGGPGHLRGAYRSYYHPELAGLDIGFRVVWSAAGGGE